MENIPYIVLKNGTVIVDHGPVTLSIVAKTKGRINTDAAVLGVAEVLAQLDALVPYLKIARERSKDIKIAETSEYPKALKRMIYSTLALNEADFTPMAAVAGTFSQLIKERILTESDADYVIVNNGGDAAVGSLTEPLKVSVGIVGNIETRCISCKMRLLGKMNDCGIATSGFGGRSLTKGIASAVTTIAEDASYADAAATSIANATFCYHPNIKLTTARKIDYQSDLKDDLVVETIGNLEEEIYKKAIENGIIRAKELYDRQVIKGAVIFAGGFMAQYPQRSDCFEITPV